jgi:tetratricopeptide (TPR) repeat protein
MSASPFTAIIGKIMHNRSHSSRDRGRLPALSGLHFSPALPIKYPQPRGETRANKSTRPGRRRKEESPAAAPGVEEQQTRWIGAAVFGLALTVRLVSLAEISASPLADLPTPDAEYYLRAGAELRREGLLSGGAFTMNPLYVVAVGWLKPLFGIAGLRCLQVVLGALTSWFIYRIGEKVFGWRPGLAAGLAFALYPMAILFSLALLPTTIAATGAGAAVLLALHTNRLERSVPALATGLVLGLTTLARPNLLLWAVAFLIWYWWAASPAVRLKTVALFLLGLALPVVAVTGRNLAVSGEPVLISSNGGINFYYGNHQGATGAFSIPPGFPNTPGEQLLTARGLAESDAGMSLGPSAVSRYWFRRGLDFLAGRPGEGALLWLKKAGLVANAREMPINEGLVEYREFSRLLRVPFPWFGIMAPLGIAGMLLSSGRGERQGKRLLLLIVAAHLAGIIPFFVSSRHRLPLVIALLPFAGLALFELLGRFSGSDRRALLRAAGILAAAAVFCWLPLIPGAAQYGYNRLGCIYLEAGDVREAEQKFRQALSHDPQYSDARYNLGNALARLERHGEAIREFQEVLSLQPGRRDATLNLGNSLTREGRTGEAESLYFEAVRNDPGFILAHQNLALNRLRSGRRDEALSGFEEIIRLDPGYARAWLQAGILMKDLPGRTDKAAKYLQTYLRLEPEGPFADMARSELARIPPGE